jgi:hypothetical protein
MRFTLPLLPAASPFPSITPSSSMPLLEGVVAAVEGRGAVVVGTVAGAVVMLELGSAVSSVLLPPHAVKRPAPRTRHNAKIAIFFMMLPPVNQITPLVLPPEIKLDRKKTPFFRQILILPLLFSKIAI